MNSSFYFRTKSSKELSYFFELEIAGLLKSKKKLFSIHPYQKIDHSSFIKADLKGNLEIFSYFSFESFFKDLIKTFHLKKQTKEFYLLNKTESQYLFLEILKREKSSQENTKQFLMIYLEELWDLYKNLKMDIFLEVQKTQKDKKNYDWPYLFKESVRKFLNSSSQSMDGLFKWKWKELYFLFLNYEKSKKKFLLIDPIDEIFFYESFFDDLISSETLDFLKDSSFLFFYFDKKHPFYLLFLKKLKKLESNIYIHLGLEENLLSRFSIEHETFLKQETSFKEKKIKSQAIKNLNPNQKKIDIQNKIKIHSYQNKEQELYFLFKQIDEILNKKADASISLFIRNWENYFSLIKRILKKENRYSYEFLAFRQSRSFLSYKNMEFFQSLFKVFFSTKEHDSFLHFINFLIKNFSFYKSKNLNTEKIRFYFNEINLKSRRKNSLFELETYLKFSIQAIKNQEKHSEKVIYYELFFNYIQKIKSLQKSYFKNFLKSKDLLSLPRYLEGFLKDLIVFIDKNSSFFKNYRFFKKVLKKACRSFLKINSKRSNKIINIKSFYNFFQYFLSIRKKGMRIFNLEKGQSNLFICNRVESLKSKQDYIFVLGANNNTYPFFKESFDSFFFYEAYKPNIHVFFSWKEEILIQELMESAGSALLFSFSKENNKDQIAHFLKFLIQEYDIHLEDFSKKNLWPFLEKEEDKKLRQKQIIKHNQKIEELKNKNHKTSYNGYLKWNRNFILNNRFLKKTFSISELEMYMKHPLSFFFSKILNINTYSNERKNIENKNKGFLYHSILEKIYKFKKHLSFNKDSERVFNLVQKKWEFFLLKSLKKIYTFKLDRIFFFKTSKIFKKELFDFISKEFPSSHKNDILEIEREFLGEFMFFLDKKAKKKLYIKGRVDRIDEDEKNNILIIDYKLKNNFSTRQELNTYIKNAILLQPFLYIYLFLKTKNENEKDVYFEYYHIINESKKLSRFPLKEGNLDFLSCEKIFEKNLKKLFSGDFHYEMGDFENQVCQYCNFHTICRIETKR